MSEDFMADNAVVDTTDNGAAAVETPVIEEQADTVQPEGDVDVVETSEPSPNVVAANNNDDVSKTKAFSTRLNQMAAKQVDDFVSSMGWVNPYDNSAVKTKADFDRYRAMQKAAEEGKDPVTESRISSLENELRGYRLAEEDNKLLNDATYGQYYKAVRDDCLNIQKLAQAKGFNTDLRTVFNTVIANRLPDIIQNMQTEVTAKTIKNINNNAAATPGALSSEVHEQKVSVADMSKEEFAKLRAEVRSGKRVIL